ncbi:MAG TPA: hypothetical protein EYG89_00195 [Bacteroidia bacterium]|nr:hypothetical protein [Bacteroidia bacterium]
MWKIIIAVLILIPLVVFLIKFGKLIEKDENIGISVFQKKEMNISEYSQSTPDEKIKFLTYLTIIFLLSICVFSLITSYFYK